MSDRRRALVAGVSGPDSVGWAIALALAERGDAVTVTCRAHRAEAVGAMAEAAGIAHAVLDVDDPKTVQQVLDGLPALDVLVHTLVRVPPELLHRPLVEVDRDAFCEVMAGSAWSLIALCRHARPLLARSDSPRVVALTSDASRRPAPRYHVAGVGKAALEASLRYLAMELGPEGVRVNGVSFSLVSTPGARAVVGETACQRTREHLASRAWTGRATNAQDVAGAVAWLTAAVELNLTGQILTIDGGFSLAYF